MSNIGWTNKPIEDFNMDQEIRAMCEEWDDNELDIDDDEELYRMEVAMDNEREEEILDMLKYID